MDIAIYILIAWCALTFLAVRFFAINHGGL